MPTTHSMQKNNTLLERRRQSRCHQKETNSSQSFTLQPSSDSYSCLLTQRGKLIISNIHHSQTAMELFGILSFHQIISSPDISSPVPIPIPNSCLLVLPVSLHKSHICTTHWPQCPTPYHINKHSPTEPQHGRPFNRTALQVDINKTHRSPLRVRFVDRDEENGSQEPGKQRRKNTRSFEGGLWS